MAKRGRPSVDDDFLLAAMADILIRDPRVSRAGAFRYHFTGRYGQQSDEAECKRLVRKFGKDIDELMIDAERRLRQEIADNRVTYYLPLIRLDPQLTTSLRQLFSLGNTPAFREIGDTIRQFNTSFTPVVGDLMRLSEQLTRPAARIGAALESFNKSLVPVDFNRSPLFKPLSFPKTSFQTIGSEHS